MDVEYLKNFEPRKVQNGYIKKVKEFRKRIEEVDTEDLEWYKSILKPENVFIYIGLLFCSKSDRLMRYHETKKLLEKRALSKER